MILSIFQVGKNQSYLVLSLSVYLSIIYHFSPLPPFSIYLSIYPPNMDFFELEKVLKFHCVYCYGVDIFVSKKSAELIMFS